jgi:Cu-Zn family superoxide dismutase
MPNLFIPESGELTFQVYNDNVSLEDGEDGYLFDDDGSALIIHAGADDYKSQPSGDAGDRIACGVIEK